VSQPVIALFEVPEEGTVGVRFPSVEAALDWEDAHFEDLTGQGRVRIVSRTEVLRLSRGSS
jgi:hypothetical protein